MARLEINVRVLSCAAQYRMIRRERPRAVLANAFLVDHLKQHFVVEHLDFRYLVRGAESVKEIQSAPICSIYGFFDQSPVFRRQKRKRLRQSQRSLRWAGS
jgi:hypothetical protein